jgi:hypothetical protein
LSVCAVGLGGEGGVVVGGGGSGSVVGGAMEGVDVNFKGDELAVGLGFDRVRVAIGSFFEYRLAAMESRRRALLCLFSGKVPILSKKLPGTTPDSLKERYYFFSSNL